MHASAWGEVRYLRSELSVGWGCGRDHRICGGWIRRDCRRLRANWELGEEVGAGFSLVHDGKPVVDLTGGTADDSGRVYDAETLQLVFSSTKGVAAICLAMLVQAGRLDYEAPVSSDLAGVRCRRKGRPSDLMGDQSPAGLASVDNPPPLEEVLAVTPIVEAIAAQVPLWELDGSHGYHAITYGWIAAEILRRATGTRMNDWLQTNVVEPLGVEFHMGLPESEHARVAPIRSAPPPSDPEMLALMMSVMGPGTMGGRALSLDGRFSLTERTPSTGAMCGPRRSPAQQASRTPESGDDLWRDVGEVGGVRLLDDATRELATTPVTSGPDKSLVMETKFGMGFMLPDGVVPFAARFVRSRRCRRLARLRRSRSGYRVRLRDEPDGRWAAGGSPNNPPHRGGGGLRELTLSRAGCRPSIR